MDYDGSTDEDADNEENWQDTNWDADVTVSSSGPCKPAVSIASVYTRDRADRKELSTTESSDGQSSVALMTRMQLNDHKAGMQGLDKEHINQIIYEASKGSRFFENERRKEEQVNLRIQEQEKNKKNITEAELQRGLAEADDLVAQLEESRDLSQKIVHVDMDAFYAAVEMRDDPSLRNKPMAVGGIGMLSTSNYEARKYGVRAAMPGFIGRKLCPQLILVPLNFPKYIEVSAQVRDIFAQYDPNFCPMSLDEAYLNFTPHLTQRQSMTVQERSFLRRCKSVVELSLCCCDLNATLRDAVVFGKEMPVDVSVLAPSNTSAVNVDNNCEIKKNDAVSSVRSLFKTFFRSNAKETDGVKVESTDNQEERPFSMCSSGMQTVSSSPITINPLVHAVTGTVNTTSGCMQKMVKPAGDDISTVQKASMDARFSKYSTDQIQERRSDWKLSSTAMCSNTTSSQVLSFKPRIMGIECTCYVCGKPVPEYEVVTFDLDVESAAQEMRCRIEQQTRLTASAGIAANMMLAKVCSDQNKPNGQFYLPSDLDKIRAFVQPLPIRKISGIGRVTEQLLGALGVTTCGDMYQQRALLYLLYSSVSFSYFMRVSCGIGSVHIARDEERKSMSTEQTFRELSRPEEQYSKCLDLCHSLATDLADEQLMGKTISLKLKTTDFQVRTRAQTISNYTNDANAIFAVAKRILRAEIQAELPDPLRLRLMGVRVSKLAPVSECHQEKQNTIKGFLNKMNSASDPPGSPSTTGVKISTSLDDAVAPAAESSDVVPAGSNGALVSSDVAPVTPSAIAGFPSVSDSHLHDICVKHNTEKESSEYGFPKTSTNSKKDINENCKDSLMYKEKTTQALSDEVDLLKSTARSRIVSADLDAASLSEPTGSDVAKLRGDFITDKQLDTGSLARSSASSDLNVIPSSSVSGEVDAASDWQLTTHDDPSIETSRRDDTAHLFVREPSYTCPVCCKDIDCINLTDFNAHIDRCLDGGQEQCQRKPAADKSKSKKHNSNTSAGSSAKISKKSQMHDSKSPQTSKAAEISRKKLHSPAIASKSQSQQQAHTVKQMHYADTEETTRFNHHVHAGTGTVYSMHNGDKPSTSDAGSNITPSLVQESTGLAKRDLSLHDCGGERKSVCEVSHDLEGLDYMVCPLCGAERADWTLKSFNQHVDTCLNRDTISQILREQKSEQKSKKRHAGGSLEDRVSSQQSVKRPKKSSSPKPGCSILSFFKN